MRVICSLLLIVMAGLIVPPRPAAAQNLGCDVMSRLPYEVRGLLGTPWTDQVQATVRGVRLTVRICTPAANSYDGEQALLIAQRALPILDQLAAVRLGGSLTRTMVMVDSETLSSQAPNADGFIERGTNIIHLHPRSLPSTVVHELAHYWANGENFGEPWMVEAYAEYLTDLTMPSIDEGYRPRALGPTCANLALRNWAPGPSPHEVCAYSVGPRVFHDLEARVGGAAFRTALARLGERPGGVNSWDLLAELERASGADLSDLMRGRVFRPEDDQTLALRSSVRARLAQATDLAAGLGLEPPAAIAAMFDDWRLDEADRALGDLLPLLTAAGQVSARCRAAELECAQPWRDVGEGPAQQRALRAALEAAAPMLDGYARLRQAGAELAVPVPSALAAAAARLDPSALPAMQAATNTLLQAGTLEDRCTDIKRANQTPLTCTRHWLAAWRANDLATVGRIVGELNGLLNAAPGVEGRCEAAKAPGCREAWSATLDRYGTTAARQALGDLGDLLDHAARVEAACAPDWPCASAWRERLAAGDIAGANAVLAAQAQALGTLRAAVARLPAPNPASAALEMLLPAPMRPDARLEAARRAFNHGDIAQAKIAVAEAIARRVRSDQAALWAWGLLGIGGLLLGGLLLAAASRRWGGRIRWPQIRLPTRKPAAPAQRAAVSDADLLERLLLGGDGRR